MLAIDLVKNLIADGVTFETDGNRIRWSNGGGRVTDAVVAEIAGAKAEVIDFLTGRSRPAKPEPVPAPIAKVRDLRRDLKPDMMPRVEDVAKFADALRRNGPTSYGALAVKLGWGATRAGQTEEALRKAERIAYDNFGMGRLIDKEEGQ